MSFSSALLAELEAIRLAASQSGLSVSGLARSAGLSQSHLANVLAGKRGLTPAVADKVNEALWRASRGLGTPSTRKQKDASK